MRHTRLALALLVLIAAPAAAQPAPPAASTPDLAWIAAGGGFAVVMAEGVQTWPAALVRVNLTHHIAAEVGSGFLLQPPGLSGVYQLQMHFAGRAPDRRVRPVFTTGALGYFETRRVSERRSTLATGDVVTYPAHRDSELSAPFALILGGGARVRVARSAWVEPGLQFWLGEDAGAFVFATNLIVALGPRR